MTIEVRLLGTLCNLACTYCYQEPIREAGNISAKYNLDEVIKQLDKVGKHFCLFGGEALLVPKEDLEKLWKYGFEKYGRNSIQTNGTLIDDDHIEMFKKYNVSVGISIDGPNELNALREVRAGKRGTKEKEEKTLEATNKTINNIKKLADAGVAVGIIITLHRQNTEENKLERLMKFIRWLGDIGVTGGNIHTLEVDPTMPDQEKYVLSQEENARVFIKLAEFFSNNPDLEWKPFCDIPKLLRGEKEKTTCYWNYCDPHNTQAVYGIEGNGGLSNCGRTNKEGIDWYKSNGNLYARYISFYHTPPEMGGCKGCRFWAICGGSCPGEAIDGDFRNKTIHCQTQKALLTFYEKKLEEEGITPITKLPYLPIIEQIMLEDMKRGIRPSLERAIDTLKQPIQVPVKKGDTQE
jgi:uncharacterized protein